MAWQNTKAVQEMINPYKAMQLLHQVVLWEARRFRGLPTESAALLSHLRLLRLQLLEQYGIPVSDITTDHPIFPWMVKHVGFIYNRFQIGQDGQSPYSRNWGQKVISVRSHIRSKGRGKKISVSPVRNVSFKGNGKGKGKGSWSWDQSVQSIQTVEKSRIMDQSVQSDQTITQLSWDSSWAESQDQKKYILDQGTVRVASVSADHSSRSPCSGWSVQSMSMPSRNPGLGTGEDHGSQCSQMSLPSGTQVWVH
eukprot:6492355-Amphidinium_carterae.3